MHSSLRGMGNLSQVNQSVNQATKALQSYPKTYQKILLQVFAHLFKKPTEEMASCFIFLSEKNKISELKLLIDSPNFNKIDLSSFKEILHEVLFHPEASTAREQLAEILINSAKFHEIDLSSFQRILLLAAHKGYEQVINKLVSSSRFKEIDSHSLSESLRQAISNGHEQVTKKLIDSPKFNELDLDSFSSVLVQVTTEGYEQLVETLMTSPKFNQVDITCLEGFLVASAEKGYIRIVKKIMDSGRFEEIDGHKLGAALYQATLHGHEELAIELLNVCHSKESIPADSTHFIRNDWGEAFKYAAQNGLDQFINRLITLGTPFDKIILNQLTASLFSASSGGHLKVVEAIIASSRFQEITQKDLNKAYQRALSGKHEQICAILKEFTNWHARCVIS